ncbi:putative LysM domain [Prochlorococcus marinus str. LG]|nr:putative LysM domain [Prochlorococcus marinus str. LG]
MDTNGIYNADNLKVGQKIKLPKDASKVNDIASFTHTVTAGQSIAKISDIYEVNELDIIKLNNIKDANILLLGQVLKLPKSAKKTALDNSNKLDFHILKRGETLYKVSRIYNIPVKKIIAFNKIISPNRLKPGAKLILEDAQNSAALTNKGNDVNDHNFWNSSGKSEPYEWRNFGPLKINWSNWKTINGSKVAPAINKEGQPLFLAINCNSTKINWSGSNGKWNRWLTPKNDFEFSLFDELCSKKN